MGITGLRGAALAALLGLATVCEATVVNGSFGSLSPLGDEVTVSFSCTLQGTNCNGVANIHDRPRECSNYEDEVTTVAITGLDLSAAHAIQGTISVPHTNTQTQANAAGVCAYTPGTRVTTTFNYNGTWDGVGRGTLVFDNFDDDNIPVHWTGAFTADVPSPVAVFPLNVSGSITPTVANIQADIQFRPQDIGTNASVFVFALAPSGLVRPATSAEMQPMRLAKTGKVDTPVACVFAQLNGSGQLQAVTASSMQAYVSGVLSAQGQSIAVLNNVPTPQVAGATFYVGYGATANAMLDGGVNRSVVTAPAAATCQPSPPQTGWWWNPAEGGRGFSMEVRGNSIFFASYLYDAAGHPVWLAASGATSLDGSLFSGRLIGFSGGQTLEGAWHARGPAVDNGAVTLAFSDASHGTMVWPGGSVPIQRFDIAAVGGHSLPAVANQPESGWWWNPQEDGRGFFVEWQGSNAFVAAYMYDSTGLPIWYASQAATPVARAFSGNWTQYAHGQTLTGAYAPPGVAISNVSPVTITFSGADAAVMTLPGGRTTALTRFRF